MRVLSIQTIPFKFKFKEKLEYSYSYTATEVRRSGTINMSGVQDRNMGVHTKSREVCASHAAWAAGTEGCSSIARAGPKLKTTQPEVASRGTTTALICSWMVLSTVVFVSLSSKLIKTNWRFGIPLQGHAMQKP
jgi:hypothetical protein